MKVKLIVAICRQNRGIGKDNQLLWHLPADMKFFKETTMGYPIITGRKNYESIPTKFRPLSGRKNILMTRRDGFVAEKGVIVVNGEEQALAVARDQKQDACFVIGGGEIYKLFLDHDLVDEMWITWVDAELEADTYFPYFSPSDWEEELIAIHDVDDKNAYPFTIVKYTRKLEQ